jgi:hypothetical protein
MKRFIIAIALLAGGVGFAVAQAPSPFRYEQVLGAFERMRTTPGFDVSRSLQWGFFFVSSSRETLSSIRSELEAKGYSYVEEHRGKDGSHWLQLAKIEIHSPESLHKRNQELFAFAAAHQGVTYDGWDVSRR